MLNELARENRKNPTEAEAIMWNLLRNHFCGLHFRRQHPISGYIADFACTSKRLIIEIDGGYHSTEEQKQKDNQRSIHLGNKGYTVLRFTNEEVICNTDETMNCIKKFITLA